MVSLDYPVASHTTLFHYPIHHNVRRPKIPLNFWKKKSVIKHYVFINRTLVLRPMWPNSIANPILFIFLQLIIHVIINYTSDFICSILFFGGFFGRIHSIRARAYDKKIYWKYNKLIMVNIWPQCACLYNFIHRYQSSPSSHFTPKCTWMRCAGGAGILRFATDPVSSTRVV